MVVVELLVLDKTHDQSELLAGKTSETTIRFYDCNKEKKKLLYRYSDMDTSTGGHCLYLYLYLSGPLSMLIRIIIRPGHSSPLCHWCYTRNIPLGHTHWLTHIPRNTSRVAFFFFPSAATH